MHMGGEGSVEKLAKGVRAAFDCIKEIRKGSPEPVRNFGSPFSPTNNAITGKPIDEILEAKGQAKDGMFKVVIGRKAKMICDCEVGKEMGVNTWAAFAGTDDNALVDGDFVVLETELQNVLKVLSHEKINVVAIHHHMTQESPRYLFIHYWGKGKAADLARSVKTALQSTAK